MRKHFFSRFISFILLFISVGAQAVTIEEVVTKKLASLAVEFQPHHKFYHYFGLSQNDIRLNTPDGRAFIGQSVMDATMSEFWNPAAVRNSNMASGAGLYAARDPYTSSLGLYGHLFLEISVHPGLKYVNIKKLINFGKEFTDADGDPGIKRAFAQNHNVLDETFLKLMLTQTDDFRKAKAMLLNVLRNLNIVAFEYKWYGITVPTYYYCHTPISSAINFFGRPIATSAGVHINTEDFDYKLMNVDFINLSSSEVADLEIYKKRIDFLSIFAKGGMAKAVNMTHFTKDDLETLRSETMNCD